MTQKLKVILSYLLIALYWIAVCLLLFGCKNDYVISSCYDGDTYTIANGERIRLYMVDAPEIGQEYGNEAKVFAQKHLLHKKVFIKKHGSDKYGRTLAEIWQGSVNFSEVLVDAGLAHCSRKYASKSIYDKYLMAKKNHVGIFKNNNYVLPYKWREKHQIFSLK